MIKKNNILILALAFMGLSASVANAQTSGKCGDGLSWSYSSGVLTITGTGNMTNFTSTNIPWWSYRKDITSVSFPAGITSIGECAFLQCSNLKSVTIPNLVASIGSSAFNQSGLESVTIPGLVTSIGDLAFFACGGLQSVNIPNTVTSIGRSAFSNCNGLTEATISCASIGGEAFQFCQNLASVTIANTVTSIGYSAFAECPGLKSITIPSSVASIGVRAFAPCENLTAITVAESNPKYSAKDGILYDKKRTALIQCPGGKTGAQSIPFGVDSIAVGAFYGCSGLTGILVFPWTITSISDEAFYGCTGLKSMIIPNWVTSIGNSAFAGSGLKSITIPGNVKNIGTMAFAFCENLTSIVFSEGITTIPLGVCENNNLASITLPRSITYIEFNAFKPSMGYCHNLTVTNLNPVPCELNDEAFGYGIDNTCTLKVPSSAVAAYKAAEVWKKFTIVDGGFSVNPVPEDKNQGFTKGQGLYKSGEKATVIAVPSSGYRFKNWTENGTEVSTANPYTFNVTKDVELVANFEEYEIDYSKLLEMITNGSTLHLSMGWATEIVITLFTDATRQDTLMIFYFDMEGTCYRIDQPQLRSLPSLSEIMKNFANGTYYYTVSAFIDDELITEQYGDFVVTNSSIDDIKALNTMPQVVGYYNIMGQRLPREPERGIYIIMYDNGKAEKAVKAFK